MNEYRMMNYSLFSMLLKSMSLSIPLMIIGAPFWVIAIVSLFVFLPVIVPSGRDFWPLIIVVTAYTILLRPGLYIWALIVAINGPQDIVAIAFYIIASLQAISIIKNFFAYIIGFFSSMNN